MSITLTDGMSTSGGLSMSPNIFSGSMEFTAGDQILYVTPASTQFDLIGDFTIEAWVYPTSSLEWGIFDARVVGGSAEPWAIGLNSAGNLGFFDGSLYTGTGVAELNVWTHVAYVRYGSNLNFYINGVLDATFTIGTGPISPGSTNPVVGTKDYALGGYGTVGNISNLRLVKGLAVYTSAFTPSTSPLTVVQPANFNGSPSAAITDNQTILLLNSDDNGFNFLDRSQNNFTLIGPDMPLPSNLSPFIGSLSFNGTDQYLSLESNTGFDQDGIFTWECWFYPTVVSGGYLWGEASYGFMSLGIGTGGTPGKLYVDMSSVGAVITSNTTITANSWYHVALVYDGTNTKLYLNGILEGTYAGGGSASGAPLWIGNYDNGALYYTGYISNFRIVKGVAVYTSNFFPPSNVLTSVQGPNVNGLPSSAISSTQTSLLLTTPNNNNSYLVDSSIYQNIVVGPLMPTPSSVVPTTDGNFDGSIFFNGSSDYLTVASDPVLAFSTGDFTVECWVNWTALTTSAIFDNQAPGGFNLYYDAGVYLGNYLVVSNRYANQIAYSWTPAIDTWYHIAISRSGTDLRMFIDGSLVTTTTGDTTDYQAGEYNIGSDQVGGPWYLNGNLSNLRVVKGIAVYTTDFTPSRQSLTSTQSLNINGIPSAAISGTETSLLLNTPNNVNYLVDSSSYNFTVTPIGSPTASSSIPTVAVANGSSLFNGTNNYLTVPSDTVYEFGTGDFTVEGWYYWNTFDNNVDTALIMLGQGANPGITCSWWMRYYTGIPALSWYRTDGTGEDNFLFPITLNAGQWYHIACTRSGTDLRFFVDGTQVGAAQTCTTDYTIVNGDPLQIGKSNTGNSPVIHYFNGYATNIRVVKGIAVYTSNFTLPTSPLTATQTANTNGNPSAAITGSQTSLLLNTFNSGLNRVDNSSYNFLVTSPNTPTPDNLAPSFVSEGSFLSNGYQYLQIPHSSYGNLFDQDGAFTIECWFYQTSYNPYGTFVWCQDVNSGDTWRCFYGNGYFGCDGPGGSITSAPIFGNLNTWYHIALSSDGITIRLFVNGTFQGSYAGTGIALTQDIPFQLAWGNYNGPYSYGIYGNMSNFRFVKGVAVYTTDFTPPTNDLTAVQEANQNGNPSAAITGSQTSLLLNTTNNVLNHLDSSTHQLLVTTPPTPVPAAWSPYNLGSILFHDGCYLQTNNSTVFNFDTNDFTIETWAYWATAKTGNETIFEGTGPTRLIFGISDTGVRLYMYDGSGGEFGCSYAFSVDTWYHIAVVRLGGNISIYVNGTLANTPFVDSKVWAFTVETIGRNNDGAEPYTGEISNLRVVNGTAVYTGNFTTPTKPLNVSQNAGANINPVTPYQTSLLLNTIDSPNNLLDSSIYNLTLSVAGTPTAVINNPFGPL